jgi:hypothetical protein
MIFEILRWWYVTGWRQAIHRIVSWPQGVEQLFSLSLLVKTLFSPWRRIVTPPGRGLDAKMHAMLDNLVSRCVGFVIRLFVIIAAGFSMLAALMGSLALAVIWPLLPPAFVFFVVKGIIG